ncbi:MAG TPA: DUF89 family protein [Caldithrix sp.]|nr:DUF89 family protein [Caldithrix sp.]
MIVSLDCIPCTVNSFLRLIKTGMLPEESKEAAMRRLLAFLSRADFRQSPPALGREMHRMIREELNNSDPYREIKEKYNRMMLDLQPQFENQIETSIDSFDTAMRLAVAGNVIDFGPQAQMDIMETINRVTRAQFAIDDSQQLRDDLKSARTLLYLGDNCGEIVMDKLFLQTLGLPEMYFAVRGGPIINDVTIEDAKLVGMEDVATVITTGDDSPGVVWETASDEFKAIFNEADVIISKGQGNLEGLIDVPQNIYFLLVIKCDLVGELVETGVGEFVIKRSPSQEYKSKEITPTEKEVL